MKMASEYENRNPKSNFQFNHDEINVFRDFGKALYATGLVIWLVVQSTTTFGMVLHTITMTQRVPEVFSDKEILDWARDPPLY